MPCEACGAPIAGSDPNAVCPQCSLASALALGAKPPESPPALEGYELIEPLGSGGMGVIWLARERSLDRLVALKVIPTGGDPRLAERILREGQAAARLRHPHVVAVHALGHSPSGTFLAMEFVEGGNLLDALRGQPMPPARAAHLALQLASALAHAHAAGILHRDVKPSNVLLGADGAPLLGDFGLAAPREGSGELTRPGQIVGTPGYLAPELLAGAKEASERSDLYGLGTVLYAALTGRPPFVADSVAAVLEQVRSSEPPPPRLLKPDIPNDLETICLHCLEKDPDRRYRSAAELQADLERFERGEPVSARPVRTWEKAWRWSARNPALASTSAAAAGLLLALAVGGPIAAVRIEQSRRSAAAEAATSKAISDFLENDLLAQAAPANQPDREIKLRTVLDRAEQRIDGRFQDRPAVEASLRETLARTYWSLGDFPTMQREVERALALRRSVSGPGDPRTLRLMGNLAVALRGRGQYAEAEQAGLAALAADRQILGPQAPETLVAMNNLMAVYLSAHQYRAAESLGEETLAIKRRVLGPEDRSTLTTMTNLGLAYDNLEKYAQADALYRAARATLERRLGPDHPNTLALEHNLAVAEFHEKKLSDAEKRAQRVLDVRLRVLGPDHPETLRTMNLLAEIYGAQGDGPRARRTLQNLLQIRRRVLGPGHPDTREVEASLAELGKKSAVR